MAKDLQLNGMIHAKFHTEAEMARTLGWSRAKLNKITNGKLVPNLFDLDAMAKALDSSLMDLASFFLPRESTNVDNH